MHSYYYVTIVTVQMLKVTLKSMYIQNNVRDLDKLLVWAIILHLEWNIDMEIHSTVSF